MLDRSDAKTCCPPLFTIGYAGMALADLRDRCRENRIQVVVDVRSSPYSRHIPDFCKTTLAAWLQKQGIKYIFMGRELGARRDEPDCYVDGVALYERIEQTEAFRRGLSRILTGVRERQLRVVLMCAEKDPVGCHRFALICRCLKAELADIRHIVGTQVEPHAQTESRLLDLYGRRADLFQTYDAVLAEVYREHGRQIAYRIRKGVF